MRIREPWPEARSRQRRREFGPLVAAIPAGGLGDGLEIGGGDGYVASLVASGCRSFVSSDSYMRRAASGTESIRRLVCDAVSLPFRDRSFDFIFSSSVLEHIRDRSPTYGEMARCLRRGGLMVHVMPSRTWKLLQMLFYYPNLAIGGVDLLLDGIGELTSSCRRAARRQAKLAARNGGGKGHVRWEDCSKFPPLRKILRGILPTVHGEYSCHRAEWRGFGASAWAAEFRRAGFDVHRIIRLPLYSGYGFGLERLRRLGELRGLSSHNAFVLSHAGDEPLCGRWFDAPGLGVPAPSPRRRLALGAGRRGSAERLDAEPEHDRETAGISAEDGLPDPW